MDSFSLKLVLTTVTEEVTVEAAVSMVEAGEDGRGSIRARICSFESFFCMFIARFREKKVEETIGAVATRGTRARPSSFRVEGSETEEAVVVVVVESGTGSGAFSWTGASSVVVGIGGISPKGKRGEGETSVRGGDEDETFEYVGEPIEIVEQVGTIISSDLRERFLRLLLSRDLL